VIKPDRWIRQWGEAGGAAPYAPEQVNAASYDVRVGDHWICPTRDPEELTAPSFKLYPGDFRRALSRSVLTRSGVFRHISNSFVRFSVSRQPLRV
jgi:hypothetical protein